MVDRADESEDDIRAWIAELFTDLGEGAGELRLDESKVQSSAFNSNVANRMTGNAAEKLNHHTGSDKSVDMPGSPSAQKHVDSNRGLITKSTVGTAALISSSHTRSLPSTDSSDQSRRGTKPNFPANSAEGSSRVQTSEKTVSGSSQQLNLPKQNVYQPSIHLFDSTSQTKQQPKTRKARLQASRESSGVNQMRNLARQQPGHQSNPPEMQQQLPNFENNVPNTFQISSLRQHNVLRSQMQLQRHQDMIATPSESSKSQDNPQQLSQPAQFLQNANTQNQGTLTSEGTQNKRQTSTSLNSQISTVSNQMQQSEESHGVLPVENASGFTATGALISSSDWRDQAYSQLQFFKEAHFEDVMRVNKKAEELSSLESATGKGTDKFDKIRLFGEQMLTFLQIPKADFFQYTQEEVHKKMKMVTWYIKRIMKDRNPPPMDQIQPQPSRRQPAGQLQQSGGENLQASVSRKEPTSTLVVPQLSSQRGLTSSQAWPINSSVTGAVRADQPSLINLHHYGQPRSATQCAPNRQLQQQEEASTIQSHSTPSRRRETSMNRPLQIDSQRTLGKRAAISLTHGSTQNILDTPPEVNSSAREMVNALDSIMRSVPSGPAPSLTPLIKQQEKYQMRQAIQKTKHSVEPGVTSESDQRMVTQKAASAEISIGQVISNQRTNEHHQLVGQTREHSSQRWVPSSTSHHHFVSPQVLQPQFPPVERMGISLTKDSITSQPTASPVPSASLAKNKKTIGGSFSPPTVVEPVNVDSYSSPMSSSLPKTQGSSGKSHVEIESSAQQKSSLTLMINPGNSEQFHAKGDSSDGLARSCLPSTTTLCRSDEKSHTAEESVADRPVYRLIQLVQSASPGVLQSFGKDIEAVVHLVDSTAGTSPYGQCREFNIDNSFPHCGGSSDTKIKRHLTTMAPDGLASPLNSSVGDDFSNHQTSDTEYSLANTIKRQKTELRDFLFEEVTETNRKLIETTLGTVHGSDADKGVTVRFTYRAVGQSKTDRSMLPDLVLQVFVADDYPHSSPQPLDPSPDMFSDNEEHKALWENTMSKFHRSLRMCSELPISLGKMARTWDSSARDAVLELAKKLGGGTFSSKYVRWEKCP